MNLRTRHLQAILLLLAAGGMTFTVLSSTHADPPSCAPFNDPGCVFGENFENGTYSGWAKNGGDVTIVAGGLNGTGRKTRHVWPAADTSAWIDSGFNLTATSGQTFWVEWWIQYDANYDAKRQE